MKRENLKADLSLRKIGDAIAWIDEHEGAMPDLDALAVFTGLSPYHFHRRFRAVTGMTVHGFSTGLRLYRAGYRLGFHAHTRITDLAYDTGYETPESFSRAFMRYFAMSPSAFRAAPDWAAWRRLGTRLDSARAGVKTNRRSGDPEITVRNFDPVTVAAMTHRGDPAQLEQTIRRFVSWRKASGITPPKSRTFTVFPVDPNSVPPCDFRVVLAASLPGSKLPVPAAVGSQDDPGAGVECIQIPGGRVAVLGICGPAPDLEDAALRLYRDWLPTSGETLRDAPVFCERLRIYPTVTEAETFTELMLPLEG